MRYSVVFWDIDGTILHGEDPPEGFTSCPSLTEIEHGGAERAAQMVRLLGHAPPRELAQMVRELETELRAEHGACFSLEILTASLYERLGIAARREESLLLADVLWGVRYREWVWPGCAEALETLHGAGVRMGVITNNAATGRMMRTALAGVGLHSFFGPVICSCDVGRQKPDPRIFNAALAALAPPVTMAVHDGAVLYVGDNPVADVQGAIAAGWDAALHLTGPETPPAGQEVLAFRDYQELVRLILDEN